jgi:hypothetical protein
VGQPLLPEVSERAARGPPPGDQAVQRGLHLLLMLGQVLVLGVANRTATLVDVAPRGQVDPQAAVEQVRGDGALVGVEGEDEVIPAADRRPAGGGVQLDLVRSHQGLEEGGADDVTGDPGRVLAHVIQVDQADVGVAIQLLVEGRLHRPVVGLVQDGGPRHPPPDGLDHSALAGVRLGRRHEDERLVPGPVVPQHDRQRRGEDVRAGGLTVAVHGGQEAVPGLRRVGDGDLRPQGEDAPPRPAVVVAGRGRRKVGEVGRVKRDQVEPQ